MSSPAELTYTYDGSFDGFLCCVFESYEKQELPQDILIAEDAQSLLFPPKLIPTDDEKARRVMDSIPKKLGNASLQLLQYTFLTCLEKKEFHMLHFLRLGYRHGPSVFHMRTDPRVHVLHKAVLHLERESHLLKGFIRFTVANGVLVSQIGPKNYVLPLLSQHFCERYPEERFLIHDKTHGMGLVYQPYRCALVPIESLELPKADQEESAYRQLWQLFYDTIAIKDRYNPKCRRGHMPQRYWQYMTEFSQPAASGTLPAQLPRPSSQNLVSPLLPFKSDAP